MGRYVTSDNIRKSQVLLCQFGIQISNHLLLPCAVVVEALQNRRFNYQIIFIVAGCGSSNSDNFCTIKERDITKQTIIYLCINSQRDCHEYLI